MNQEVATSNTTAPIPSGNELDERKKGGIPSYKIKNHLAVWIEDGDYAFICDQDDEDTVKKVRLTELAAVLKRPGMEVIFYDAEPTLKLLLAKNIPIPTTFHCAHTQVILGLGQAYRFHKLDAIYDAVYGEGKPTTGEARAFALWWVAGEYLADPEVQGTYLLKISEIRKKLEVK